MLTKNQIEHAAEEIAYSIEVFGDRAGIILPIMKLLECMVANEEQLKWFVSTMVNQVGSYHGTKEMRGVFCSRFRPADEMEAECTKTEGFTPRDLEVRMIRAHEEGKTLESGKTMARLGAPVALEAIAEEITMDVPANRKIRTTSVPRRDSQAETTRRLREILHISPARDKTSSRVMKRKVAAGS